MTTPYTSRTARTARVRRLLAAPLIGVLALGAIACGDDDDTSTTIDADAWDQARIDAARDDARDLLGMSENDLPDDVRIARRGGEEFALTMDMVPGRRTVELDQDGSEFRVVSVSLELPDGSETFDLESS